MDDEAVFETCGKKSETPSQYSLVFADQLAGPPNPEQLGKEVSAASSEPEPPEPAKPALSARFTRKSTGWT
jgi:hypothetical protein